MRSYLLERCMKVTNLSRCSLCAQTLDKISCSFNHNFLGRLDSFIGLPFSQSSHEIDQFRSQFSDIKNSSTTRIMSSLPWLFFILAIERHFVSLVALSADRYLPTPFGPYRLTWFWFSLVRFMRPKSDPARVTPRNSCLLRWRSHSPLKKSFITVAFALPWFWIFFLWKLDADTEIFRYLFRNGKQERIYSRLLTHSWSWTHQQSKRYGIEFCVKDQMK